MRIPLGIVPLAAVLVLAIPGPAAEPRYAAPVRIVTDRYGIPHIRATTERDLYRAWGWVTARDRLWQVMLSRAQSQGLTHRWFGNGALRADGGAQLFRFAERAEAIWARDRADSALRVRAEAYAAGINDYLTDIEAGREAVPAEFSALHIRPAPWRPQDSVLLMLGFGVTLDLALPELAEADRVREQGLERARDHDRFEDRWIEATIPSGSQAPAQATTSDERPAGLPAGWRAAAERAGGDRLGMSDPESRASNVFAVGARRSASGAPILANDPHLALTQPGALHVVHVLVPGRLDAIGAAVPGLPAIVSGRNETCAWGTTALGADVIDVYADSLSGDGRRIRTATGWAPIVERPFDLRVRFAGLSFPAFGQVRREAPQGPILVYDRKHHRALVARWSAMEDARITFTRLIALEQSGTAAELAERFRSLVTPTLNLIAADVSGDVRYQTVGLVPKRWSDPGPGVFPDDATHAWRGYIPADSMPAWRVPADGFAVNANNLPGRTASEYAWPRFNWAQDRAARMRERLAGDAHLTVADAWSVQNDAWSRAGARWAPLLLAAVDTLDGPWSARERAALDSVRAWDHYARRSRVGATVFRGWLGALQRATDTGDAPGLLYATLVGEPGARIAGPDSLRPALAARHALATALDTLAARLGPELGTWRWGRADRARFRHPLAERVPGGAARWEPPLTPIDGDRSSPAVGGARLPWSTTVVHGPVFRHVVDLAERRVSWGVIAPANADGPWRGGGAEMRQRWADHHAVPFYLDWARIEAIAADVHVLTP